MTVRINFLPRSYQPPKQMGAKEWGVIGAAALAVVATGAFYAKAYASTGRLEEQITATEAQHLQVKTRLAEAAQIKTREDRVARSEADLKALGGRHWSGVLLTLRELTPQQVTWTSLKADGDNLILKGTSRGLVDVAQLLGGLVDHPEVADVALKYVDEKGIPVVVEIKAADKAEPGQEPQKQPKGVTPTGEFRVLEFEMGITLQRAEGGELSHGA